MWVCDKTVEDNIYIYIYYIIYYILYIYILYIIYIYTYYILYTYYIYYIYTHTYTARPLQEQLSSELRAASRAARSAEADAARGPRVHYGFSQKGSKGCGI